MIQRLEQFADAIDDSSARRAWWTEILISEPEKDFEFPCDLLVESLL